MHNAESQRAGPQGLSLRSAFLATRHDYYELAIDRLMRLQLAEEACEVDRAGLDPQARRLVEHLVDANLQVPINAATLAARYGAMGGYAHLATLAKRVRARSCAMLTGIGVIQYARTWGTSSVMLLERSE